MIKCPTHSTYPLMSLTVSAYAREAPSAVRFLRTRGTESLRWLRGEILKHMSAERLPAPNAALLINTIDSEVARR